MPPASSSTAGDITLSATADPAAAAAWLTGLTLNAPRKFVPPPSSDGAVMQEQRTRLCRGYVRLPPDEGACRLHLVLERASVKRVTQTRPYMMTLEIDVGDSALSVLSHLDEQALSIVHTSVETWFNARMTPELIDEYYRGSTVGDPKSKCVLARIVALGTLPPDCGMDRQTELDVRLRLIGVLFRPQLFTPVWRVEAVQPSPPVAVNRADEMEAAPGGDRDDNTVVVDAFHLRDEDALDMSDTEEADVPASGTPDVVGNVKDENENMIDEPAEGDEVTESATALEVAPALEDDPVPPEAAMAATTELDEDDRENADDEDDDDATGGGWDAEVADIRMRLDVAADGARAALAEVTKLQRMLDTDAPPEELVSILSVVERWLEEQDAASAHPRHHLYRRAGSSSGGSGAEGADDVAAVTRRVLEEAGSCAVTELGAADDDVQHHPDEKCVHLSVPVPVAAGGRRGRRMM